MKKSIQTKSSRDQNGSVIALSVMGCVGLVSLAAIVYFVAQELGGSRETANAVDAAAVNVAKQALLQPALSFDPGTEQGAGIDPYLLFDTGLQFGGCVDHDPFNGLTKPSGNDINLLTYNRCVGQSMLVGLNAGEICSFNDFVNADPKTWNPQTEAFGGNRAFASNNAKTVYRDCNYIAQRLTAKLNESGRFQGSASALGGNSQRMISTSAENNLARVAVTPTYLDYQSSQDTNLQQSSDAYQGDPTNLQVNDDVMQWVKYYANKNMPGGAGADALKTLMPVTQFKSNSGNPRLYLAGYRDTWVPNATETSGDGNTTFSNYSVEGCPIKNTSQAHLVSAADVSQSATSFKNDPARLNAVTQRSIPNAFQVAGQVMDSRYTNKAHAITACAQPSSSFKDYKISIPYGFIDILLPPAPAELPDHQRLAGSHSLLQMVAQLTQQGSTAQQSPWLPGSITDQDPDQNSYVRYLYASQLNQAFKTNGGILQSKTAIIATRVRKNFIDDNTAAGKHNYDLNHAFMYCSDPASAGNRKPQDEFRDFVYSRCKQMDPDNVTAADVDRILNQKLSAGSGTWYIYIDYTMSKPTLVLSQTRPPAQVLASQMDGNKANAVNPLIAATKGAMKATFSNALQQSFGSIQALAGRGDASVNPISALAQATGNAIAQQSAYNDFFQTNKDNLNNELNAVYLNALNTIRNGGNVNLDNAADALATNFSQLYGQTMSQAIDGEAQYVLNPSPDGYAMDYHPAKNADYKALNYALKYPIGDIRSAGYAITTSSGIYNYLGRIAINY